MTDPMFAHIGLTHPNGDQCIWLDDHWFVPLDVGGEGYACPHEHPFMAFAWNKGFDAGEQDVFNHEQAGWESDHPCIENPYDTNPTPTPPSSAATSSVVVVSPETKADYIRQASRDSPDTVLRTPNGQPLTARTPHEPHEHDAAGCLDCDCFASPMSSRIPCTCPPADNTHE